MKKVIAAVAIVLLVAVFAQFNASDVAFANDDKLLPPENLSVTVRDGDYYLTYENVPDNNGYEVVINGVSSIVDKNVTSVPLDVETGSEFFVKIRVLGNSEKESSDFYETTLVIGRALGSPENLSVSDDKTLSFDPVDGAASYDVVINGVSVATGMTKTEMSLVDILTSPISYEIKVRANGDNRLTYDGAYSTLSYDNVMQLGTPENVVVSNVDGEVILSFDGVAYANEYEIDVNGEILKTTDNIYNLTDKVSVPEDYTIKVRATGNNGFTPSEWATTTYECRKTIESPLLSLRNETVSWAKTEGADEYSVIVTFMGVEVEKFDRFSGTSYDLSDVIKANGVGEYAVKVQALTNGNYDYSDVTTIYYRRYGTLAAPTVTVDGNIVSWTAVENAVEYTIKIDGRIISRNVSATEFDISAYVAEVKTYTITVAANANGWYYESAEGCATFVKQGALASPVISANGKVVSWTEVLGATAYDVYVGGVKVVTVTENTADLTIYLQKGENTVKVVATAKGFSDGESEEVVVICETSDNETFRTYKLTISNETAYIVFVDGKRSEYKIENGTITLPVTAEKMIIVPDITELPTEGEYVMLYSEFDLTKAAESGDEYEVEIGVYDAFDSASLEPISESDADNELGEYILDSGVVLYYLNEKDKYRPV